MEHFHDASEDIVIDLMAFDDAEDYDDEVDDAFEL